MTDAEKWSQYDCAKHAIGILISHLSARIYAERKGEAPSQEQIGKWRSERTELVHLRRALTVDDMATIGRVNDTYGPRARAVSTEA